MRQPNSGLPTRIPLFLTPAHECNDLLASMLRLILPPLCTAQPRFGKTETLPSDKLPQVVNDSLPYEFIHYQVLKHRYVGYKIDRETGPKPMVWDFPFASEDRRLLLVRNIHVGLPRVGAQRLLSIATLAERDRKDELEGLEYCMGATYRPTRLQRVEM